MMIDLKMEKSDEIVGEFLESVAGWGGLRHLVSFVSLSKSSSFSPCEISMSPASYFPQLQSQKKVNPRPSPPQPNHPTATPKYQKKQLPGLA